MKTFLQVFLAIFISLGLVLVGAILFFSLFFESSPEIPDHAFLQFDLSGNLSEYSAPDPIEEALGRSQLDIRKIRDDLEKAAVDKRIKSLIFRPELLNVGFGKLRELYALIQNFRASGKRVYAYLGSDFSFTRDYYLACAADSIIMPPDANLFLTGVRSEVTFYKDFFTKIGVEAQFLQIGKYKNAPDVYTRDNMSPYHREVLKKIINQYYDDIVQTISKSRNLSVEKVDYLINNVSGFTGRQAMELGLVDTVSFYAGLTARLKKQNKSIKKLSALNYSQEPASSLKIRNKRRIAVINCIGIIYGGSETDNPMLGKMLGAKTIIRDIQRAAKSRSIKAIILRIDSPGGAALPSAEIWKAVLEAKQKKPVVASISDLGASGGFYIAMAADTIVATANSLVGSIGIFAGKFNLSGTYEKLGFKVESVERGSHADLFSMLEPWDKEEQAIMHRIISTFYRDFVRKVAQSRKMTFEEADKIARGRVWTGKEAFEIGLIDTVGSFYTALKIAQRMAGIPESESVRLIYYPRKKSFMNELLGSIGAFVFQSDRSVLLTLKRLESVLQEWQNKPLALMPFRLQFK
ncbi:MAG: signal peptide peptidase SppA [Calditrichaeota bacterium]|nr:signal peptide peptidase SppA [Calditrichota bacterium]